MLSDEQRALLDKAMGKKLPKGVPDGWFTAMDIASEYGISENRARVKCHGLVQSGKAETMQVMIERHATAVYRMIG